ncbi:MAG: coproporphyrinogen dehydrogenase HemZ [Christensenellaceae bacterium]|nr:coproporphyrinogen dehydrogenase HemZ [Christensenellaceae bacterium]
MVYLVTNTPEFFGDICDEIRLFLDVRHIEQKDEPEKEGFCIVHRLEEDGAFAHTCFLFKDGVEVSSATHHAPLADALDELEYKKIRKRGAKISVFRCLKAYFGEERPWGSLTGVRPSKLLRDSRASLGSKAADKLFYEEFDISKKKLDLLKVIADQQDPVIGSAKENDIDLYFGIPFCTSRCAYCSFSSALTTGDGSAEGAYVEALLREVELLEDLIAQKNVRNIYIGGGTPTALSAKQLEKVVTKAAKWAKGEFTVEAGRPDTITREKLAILIDAGVNRLSVNPQSTCDETLKKIGRVHTAREFFEAAKMAAEFGFDVINMDLIVGLPGEGRDEFFRSLGDVLALEPGNITVHTLAIKRASKFGMENAKSFADRQEAEAILEESQQLLAEKGYLPYYLYRQKYMAGNLENVGYARPGAVCEYNIDIMEEVASILAFGAGGISKKVWRDPKLRIQRAPAVKDIRHYVTRTQEMAERKRDLFMGGDC